MEIKSGHTRIAPMLYRLHAGFLPAALGMGCQTDLRCAGGGAWASKGLHTGIGIVVGRVTLCV